MDSCELIATSGATSGLSLVASILLDRQGTVFVENPTYFIASKILQGDHGLNVVPVDLNEDGIDCDKLEQAVIKYRNESLEKKDGRFSCMFYTIPNFHNPTGVCYTDEVSKRLISIAEQNNMLVICDDVYNLLNYNDKVILYFNLEIIFIFL